MAEEPVDRRRRRRRRRRGGGGRGREAQRQVDARREQASAPTPPALPDWQWRTFPVFLAFVAGIVLMGLAVGSPTLGLILFFVALAGVAFGLARILTRMIIARRRQ